MPSPLPRDEKHRIETNVEEINVGRRESVYVRGRSPPRYSEEPRQASIVFSERSRAIQEFFSELFGTFIMVLFGDGVVAQVVLSKGTQGDPESIHWAWGYVLTTRLALRLDSFDAPHHHQDRMLTSNLRLFRVAVMLGAFVAKKSGAHLNPAVTLANCVYRRFPWGKFPLYAIAQLLGAMLGALVVYTNYSQAIDVLEGGAGVRTVGITSPTSSAGVFSTYPVPFLSSEGQFFSEFLSSAILMFCIFSLADAGLGNMVPLFLLFLVFGIGASFGWQTGYAMNLARDFGPRLVCYFVGWGSAVFTAGGTYFWVRPSPHLLRAGRLR